MKNRLGLIAGLVTAGLLIAGIAWAAMDSGSPANVGVTASQETEVSAGDASVQAAAEVAAVASTESTLTTAAGTASNGESTVNLNLAAGTETEILVEDAGTIRLANSGTTLTILSAQPAAGFVVEIEVPEGREVEADFRGNGRRLQFNAELEDGTIRVRIRSEANANTGSTSTTSTTNGTTNGTSTTIDDNGGDDNRGNVPNGPVTYNVGGAGSVTVIFLDGQAQLGLVSPAAGWSIEETRQRSDEVEVRFSDGDNEARLKVRIENGQVRVEIENKD